MAPLIPDINLSYPVLIIIGSSSGSGFLLNSSDSQYLVTAAHVLLDTSGTPKSDKATVVAYGRARVLPIRIHIDISAAMQDSNFIRHPNADVALIRIATLGEARAAGERPLITSRGVVIENFHQDALVGVPAGDEGCKLYADVTIGNDVMVFGYPNSIGMPGIPQIDHSRPLLRKGTVAGKNDKSRRVILDCSMYFGNSGGLAVEISEENGVRSFKAIGIVTELIPFVEKIESKQFSIVNQNIENSGYSVVVPMDCVLELIPRSATG
jgi:hypothetical protein